MTVELFNGHKTKQSIHSNTVDVRLIIELRQEQYFTYRSMSHNWKLCIQTHENDKKMVTNSSRGKRKEK